ncbi:MAG: ABC-2 transporter permease [Agathobacter sp.]|nr:ABC-2 transporter permease [Agathobacter sp.]
MKGLLIKDFYQMQSYLRVFLVVVLFCVLAGFSNQDAVFMTYYPAILMGMMPITMYSYDEKENFLKLLSALPMKKRTYVTEKYIFGFMMVLLACAATGTVQAIKMSMDGSFVLTDFALIMTLPLAIGMVAPSIVLPLIFLLGTEKGRFVNILVMAIALSFIKVFMDLGSDFQIIIDAKQLVFLLLGGATLLYFISWLITSTIFEKKEY